MTDFEKLSKALSQTPMPDRDRKARTLAAASEIFDAHQETRADARLRDNQPKKVGSLKRISEMFAPTLRPALYVTSSLVVVGLAVVMTGPHLTPPAVVAPKAPAVQSVPVAEEAVMDTAEVRKTTSRPAPAPASPRTLAEGRGLERAMNSAATFAAEDAQVMPLPAPHARLEGSNDRFANAETNPLKVTAEEPVSTFSIDVDTASYAMVRRWLNGGQLPPPEAVRVEEMINYFKYERAAPATDHPFAVETALTGTPWNPDTQLLHVALQGKAVPERPPLDLVFLVDTSGSMQSPDKLPLLQQSLRMLLGALQPEDTVALVTYAGSSVVALEPTQVSERSTIERALMSLTAGGGTAGADGLRTAYDLVAEHSDGNRLSRVILATDGDFNIGLSSPDEMKRFIELRREHTSLSVLGFGRGNLNDRLMQSLAQNGNGQAAYIDTAQEANRALVENIGSMVPIAGDVKIQIEFNPAQIAEYRLIGYETRGLAREDFNNDRVDAGDIGAGHAVTAIYEITPVGSPAQLTEPLRYGARTTSLSDETGFLRLRYKNPGEDESTLLEEVLPASLSDFDSETAFATAIAGFGQLLRGADAVAELSWDQVIALAEQGRGTDPSGARTEAIALMRLAKFLSQ